jgi:hypothetical protein
MTFLFVQHGMEIEPGIFCVFSFIFKHFFRWATAAHHGLKFLTYVYINCFLHTLRTGNEILYPVANFLPRLWISQRTCIILKLKLEETDNSAYIHTFHQATNSLIWLKLKRQTGYAIARSQCYETFCSWLLKITFVLKYPKPFQKRSLKCRHSFFKKVTRAG